MLSEHGFRSFINVYTRTLTGCTHQYLDHIFLKCINYVHNRIETGVIQTYISDLYLTVMALEFKHKVLSHNNNNVYKIINYNKLNDILKIETWSKIHSMNVNKCFDSFIDKITHAINFATTIKNSNAKNKHVKEWMTMSLLRSVRRKNALSLKVKKHTNNGKLRAYYIKYKNIFSCLSEIRKIIFIKKNLVMFLIVQN